MCFMIVHVLDGYMMAAICKLLTRFLTQRNAHCRIYVKEKKIFSVMSVSLNFLNSYIKMSTAITQML